MTVHLFTSRRASGTETAVELPRSGTNALGRRGQEAVALLLCAASAYLCLALAAVQVDPSDPSVEGRNWVGPVGGAIAGALARGFGLVAWLAPLELAVLGAPLFRGKSSQVTGLRVAGDLVVAIVASALLHVAFPELLVFGAMPSGGNVGELFGELMRALFSTVGSFLIGVTVVGLILIGRSSFSFIEFVERLEQLGKRLWQFFQASMKRVAEAWQQARTLRRERAQAAREAEQPHIDTARSDEAILAHLEEDESDWIPVEKTGPPPLALSEALRAGLAQRPAGLVDLTTSAGFQEDSRSGPCVAGTAHSGGLPGPSVAGAAQSGRLPGASPEREPEKPPTTGAAPPAAPKGAKGEPTIVDTRPNHEVKRGRRAVRSEGFALPATELLQPAQPAIGEMDRHRILELSQRLEKTLLDYGVTGKVMEIHPGPTVTTYEVAPEAGTKVSKIASLADDLALGLSRKVRIVAPIPGKPRIGFELPNDEREPVNLRELIEDKRFDALAAKAPLPVVLGRDIVGAPFYADLASMPHVIVAGATGAGKSVGLNVMLSSLLFRKNPDQLRLLMIDPKVVELAPFDGIPHMLLPVVTDMKQAATALKWAVDEMERRYQLFANAGTKNIATYNRWVERIAAGELPPPDPTEVLAITPEGGMVSVPCARTGSDGVTLPGKLPFIVIVVDEFADLMLQQGKEVEASVARLAQKARAAGMHVVLATQRPSVDVITGMIKANFPTRIAFRVAQKVDSRTILDEQGAELLLGKGDMLVKMNGSNETRRVQCPFVSEDEVASLTDWLRKQGTPEYHDAILRSDEDSAEEADDMPVDPRFDEAVRIVAETQRCSTSWLQRKMTIGYNRAAKIVELMERRGMVGPPNGARDREVLLPPP